MRQATLHVLGPDPERPVEAPVPVAIFVAPGTLITSARLVRSALTSGSDDQVMLRNPHIQSGARLRARVRTPIFDGTQLKAGGGGLAILELLTELWDHQCVWLPEHDAERQEFAMLYGWGAIEPAYGEESPFCAAHVPVTWGAGGPTFSVAEMCLPGVGEGSPLVDLAVGTVIGLLARPHPLAVTAIRTSSLREHGAEYQRLIAAHDVWHGWRHLHADGWHWVDEQQSMGPIWRSEPDSPRERASSLCDPPQARSMWRAEEWSPYDRRAALALLAGLPPPPDSPSVARLVAEAAPWNDHASGAQVPLLPMWRDGAGLLYDGDMPEPASVQLRYLWLVAEHASDGGEASTRLKAWVDDRLGGLSRREQADFRRLRNLMPHRSSQSPPTPDDCWQKGGAVLVGVRDYDHLAGLCAVYNNLDDLRQVLTTDFGIPTENCAVVRNPRTPVEIHDVVEEVMGRIDPASGALFFYYVGHGSTDPANGHLLLSLAGTRRDRFRPYDYWDFRELRKQLITEGPLTRLVLLDSCYSGAALGQLSTADASVLAIDGTYVMASSPATEPSSAPEGARHTAFTGQVLDTLTQGIPSPHSVIDADALFNAVRARCLAAGLPIPVRQVRNDGARIPIISNKAYRRPAWDTSSA
ncbi:caspase family protein [Streptomyces sp. NPDC059456]|uniref:caspase, EACC1-associated type n=1 Tax=Streptomyces sp. NPDC059456 TaxID=3346838 RepID=UPI003679854B